MAYSDEQKAVALAALEANRGDFKKTAKFCKIQEMTIRRWSKGQNVHAGINENVNEKKEALADKLERLALALADAAFERMDEAGLQPITTSMAIAIDKMQLLREKPTNITGQYDDVSAKQARLDELMERRRRRVSEPAGMGGDTAAETVN